MKEWKKNVLLTCFSIAFALLLGEGVVRLIEEKPIDIVTHDPVLKYKITEGEDFDANGFRNPAVLTQANIVTFGDSMTAGNGVTREESWPSVLGVLASTSVYNMAVSGYGPVQYAKLSEDATALNPRIALVGLYTGNDMYDAYDLAYNFDAWKALRDPAFATATSPVSQADGEIRTQVLAGAKKGTVSYYTFTVRYWFREHVHLYALLGNASRTLREKIGLAHSETEKLADVAKLGTEDPSLAFVYDKDEKTKTILSAVYRRDVVDLSVPTTKEGWRIAEGRLHVMAEQFQAPTTTMVVVVIIPTKELAYTLYMDKMGDIYPVELKEYQSKELELIAAIQEYCATEKIACLDITPAYVEAIDAKVGAFKPVMDGHPAAPGYGVIAETVFDYLKSHNLI